MQIFFRHFAEPRQQIDTGFYYSILHYLELPSPEFKATEEPLDTSVKVRNNKWTLFKHGHLELRKSWIKNHFEWFYVRMKNFEKRLVVVGFISSLLGHGGYFSEDELSIGQEQENYHSQEISGHLHFFLVLALWP